MPERSSKRKARRDSPVNSLDEPESSSMRTENTPSLSVKDFMELSEKIEKSVSKRIKDTEVGQREILKMIENLTSKIDTLAERPPNNMRHDSDDEDAGNRITDSERLNQVIYSRITVNTLPSVRQGSSDTRQDHFSYQNSAKITQAQLTPNRGEAAVRCDTCQRQQLLQLFVPMFRFYINHQNTSFFHASITLRKIFFLFLQCLKQASVVLIPTEIGYIWKTYLQNFRCRK